ncbi:MAG: hypothetical protein ACE37B_11105 [Ilumatobacter sp.]|uniref:hypothetical protein n=1 Tax=Ilumatobacter sp. TaxID=1967498 RepID=UPI00391A31A6
MSDPTIRRAARRRTGIIAAVLPPLIAATVFVPSDPVAASPLDDVSPSSDGLPGAALFTQILSWGFWLALGVCGLAILYGAATWRGMNGNSGRGVEGKMYVAAGAIGAMVIGLAPTIVRVLFDAGQAG